MVRFLHAADIHLDSPLRGLQRYEHAPVDRIRNASRRAFENLIQLAIDEKVDFLLLAGDLYDGDWRDWSTGLYLTGWLGRLREAGIPVLLIRGNHDAENVMSRDLRLPDNVQLLPADSPATIRLDHCGVLVHGQSYARPKTTDDLSKRYPAAAPGWVNIGLLHTGLHGLEGHEPYAPCTAPDLLSKSYDYWALGHIHNRQIIAGHPSWVVFPGNIQGRHARETGPKGAYLVEIDGGRVREPEFRRLDVVRWDSLVLDARAITRPDDLIDHFVSGLDRLLAEESPDRLLALRLTVRGPCPCHDALRAQAHRIKPEIWNLANDRGLGRSWVEKVYFETTRECDEPSGEGALEEIFAVLRDMRIDPAADPELVGALSDLASKLPPGLGTDHDDDRIDRPVHLRKLLEDVEPILLDRLRTRPARDEASLP